MDFTNKSVIVTGSSVGMGKEIALRFAALGAKVVVNYTSAEQSARETLEAIKKAGGTAIIHKADVSKAEDAEGLVAAAVKEFGKLDILVNNAGITRFIDFANLDGVTDETWDKLFSVNVVGTFNCSRAAARVMKGPGGVIVNNATTSATRPAGSSLPYCVSKAALLHLNSCLAVALAPTIRVNAVSPGAIVDTRWNAGRENFDAQKATEAAAATSLLGRGGKSGDIAEAVLFLASDEAAFITGAELRVDGGRFFKV